MKQIIKSLLAILIASMLVFPAHADQHDVEEFDPLNEATVFTVKQFCRPTMLFIQLLSISGQQLLFSTESISIAALDFRPYYGLGMFFVNQETGEWTMLTVYDDSMACITAYGSDFEPQ